MESLLLQASPIKVAELGNICAVRDLGFILPIADKGVV